MSLPLASSPYVPPLSLPPLLQTLCLMRSHKEIIYSCPQVRVCISMPAEHVNLSRGYRRGVVKLSSDSLQQDDHRMPVAWRIRIVVTISNGGPNVLLHCILRMVCLQCSVLYDSLIRTTGASTQLQLGGEIKTKMTAAAFFHCLLIFISLITLSLFCQGARHITCWRSVWAAPLLFEDPAQCLFVHLSALVSVCQMLRFRVQK